MARSFNVSYRFTARDGFTAIANRIRSSNRRLGNSFRGLNTAIRRSASSFRGMASDFSSGFKSIAAAAVAFFGIKEFLTIGANFQTAMADMSSITGATGKDLEFFREETLRLAKASATMAPEVATAFKTVASAKSELLKDPKGLSKVTEQVLLLKNAANIDLGQAANVLLESLNQFGAGADRAAEFVNVLAAGSKIGASEVGNTGAAIVKAGVTAKLAKIGFVELNAAIQVLAKNGIKAELAGTGLKTALLALETSKVKAIKPSVVGLSKALENLSNANLSATQLEKLFGREALSVGDILIKNRKLLGQWTAGMTRTNVAQVQATTNMNTFGVKMRRLKIIIQDALIKTFIRLEPTLSKLAVQFGKFIEGIKPGEIDGFAKSLIAAVEVVKIMASALGLVFGVLQKIGKAIGEITAAVATLDFSNFSDDTIDTLINLNPIVATSNIILDLSNASLNALGFPSINETLFGKESSKVPIKTSALDKNKEIKPTKLPASITPTKLPENISNIILNNEIISPLDGVFSENKTITDININVKDKPGVIESITNVATGLRKPNVGLNVAGG